IAAPPYSPPRARPWASRRRTRMIGARMPIWAYVGSTPTRAVETPITVIVTRNVNLRPTMSPIRPKTAAPKGRTAKPAPKVASDASRAASLLPFGKNWVLKNAARTPYRYKSYHSMIVPAADAPITNGSRYVGAPARAETVVAAIRVPPSAAFELGLRKGARRLRRKVLGECLWRAG